MRIKNLIFGVLIVILTQIWGQNSLAQVQTNISQEVISDYFDMAENYKESGEYQKALDFISMIINYEPKNYQAKYEKAYLLKLLNRSEDARKVFFEALELNKEYKTSELAQEFIPAPSPEPYGSEYYMNGGVKYLNEKNPVKASEYLRKSVRINPKNAVAYNYLGVLYWQNKNYKTAAKQFKKSYCLDKTNSKALLNLALMYKETGEMSKYYYYLHKAQKVSPKDALTKWCLGNCSKERGNILKAIDYYTEAIELSANFAPAYVSLGNTMFEVGKYEEAYEIYNKALALTPEDAELSFFASKTALLLQRNDEALALINNAIKIKRETRYELELAKINYLLDNIPEALKGFERVLKEEETPELLNYIGLCYYKQKNAQKAIQYFRKVVDADPGKPNYYYNLAQCYKTLGDKKAFFKYLDMATKILPKTPQDYIDMSYIYFDNGSKTLALKTLSEGIEKFPQEKKLYLVKLALYNTIGDMNSYVQFKEVFDEKFNK